MLLSADSPLPDDATPILEHLSLVTALHQPGPPEARSGCAHSSASVDIASVGLTQDMADASTSLTHRHPDPAVNSAATAPQNDETIHSLSAIQATPLLPIHHGSTSGPSPSTGAFSHVSPLVAAVLIPVVLPNPGPSAHTMVFQTRIFRLERIPHVTPSDLCCSSQSRRLTT